MRHCPAGRGKAPRPVPAPADRFPGASVNVRGRGQVGVRLRPALTTVGCGGHPSVRQCLGSDSEGGEVMPTRESCYVSPW